MNSICHKNYTIINNGDIRSVRLLYRVNDSNICIHYYNFLNIHIE